MTTPSRLPPVPDPLPRQVTDAHTHLASTRHQAHLTVPELLQRAAQAGVTRVVDVGCDVPSSRETIGFAEDIDTVVACVAIHPNDAARLGPRLDEELAALESLVGSSPRVRGVGETGLDYYRTTDPRGIDLQKRAFAAHLAWAKAHGLALVIHDRDAHADILDVLDAEGVPETVVMHCFSGDAGFARQCLDRGVFLSFPGTVTFKPNHALREALALTPADRLLVETDAPYLTPMPYRGRTNGSWLIPHTVAFMAEQRGDDLATLCDALDRNATAVFGEWGRDG